MEREFEEFRRAALENEAANDKEINRLREESKRLTMERESYQSQRGKKIGFMDVPDEVKLTNEII